MVALLLMVLEVGSQGLMPWPAVELHFPQTMHPDCVPHVCKASFGDSTPDPAGLF